MSSIFENFRLKELDYSIYAIGVGNSVNKQELIEIASPGRVFLKTDYDVVFSSYKQFNDKLCDEPAEVELGAPTVEIELPKESFRYFKYNIKPDNETRQILVTLKKVEGDMVLLYSFTDQNPNNMEVISQDTPKRSIRSVIIYSLQFNPNLYLLILYFFYLHL